MTGADGLARSRAERNRARDTITSAEVKCHNLRHAIDVAVDSGDGPYADDLRRELYEAQVWAAEAKYVYARAARGVQWLMGGDRE